VTVSTVIVESFLTQQRTHCHLRLSSKKRALQEAATRIAATDPSLNSEDIYQQLSDRERLGSTAIGQGVAIPHCRMPGCRKVTGALITLAEPVDFEAFDDEPVSTLFVLLVPPDETDEHLKVLALLARNFESEQYRRALTTARGDDELYARALYIPDDADT